ncbi:MAG TPA: hypothetical protein PKY50_16860 [Candidatus Competibacter sp.]|nr:hypothetical protein [Candidatus Competibacter sp.]
MTLRYTRARELTLWPDRVAEKGEMCVRFWLGLGEQAVFFKLGDDPHADPIPGEFRRFL